MSSLEFRIKEQAQSLGFLSFQNAGNAAIDCDDNFGAARRDLPEGFAVEAIAFIQAMGDIKVGLRSEKP